MKLIKSVLFLTLFSVVGFAQQAKPKKDIVPPPPKKTELNWNSDRHDFGEIERGVPVSYKFEFVNQSDKPVILTRVKPSCGCTATDYSKEPIQPGATGFVKATYNASGSGSFHKAVTVSTNEEHVSPKTLILKGKVKKAKPAPAVVKPQVTPASPNR